LRVYAKTPPPPRIMTFPEAPNCRVHDIRNVASCVPARVTHPASPVQPHQPAVSAATPHWRIPALGTPHTVKHVDRYTIVTRRFFVSPSPTTSNNTLRYPASSGFTSASSPKL